MQEMTLGINSLNYVKARTKSTNELLNLLNNDIKLVNVIEYREMENSLFWIKSYISALNNLRPIDCVNDDKLLKRLKECLLRMD